MPALFHHVRKSHVEVFLVCICDRSLKQGHSLWGQGVQGCNRGRDPAERFHRGEVRFREVESSSQCKFCQQKATFTKVATNVMPTGVSNLRVIKGEALFRWTICKPGESSSSGNQEDKGEVHFFLRKSLPWSQIGLFLCKWGIQISTVWLVQIALSWLTALHVLIGCYGCDWSVLMQIRI